MKVSIKALFILLITFLAINVYGQQKESNSKFRREFLDNINRTRQKGCTCGTTYMPPAPPLIWNEQLETAAIGHAFDMADENYFSHTSKDGRTMEKRIATAGYTFKGFKSFMIGENIAEGQQSIAEVMQGWFKSEGHCKNLMNPGFKEVGIAVYNHYWVQDFGGRETFSADQQKLLRSGKYRLIEKQ
ncbi:CAP domain-containing protein [Mucilaginibacter sp.]|uniref:CAP domain-containing protein n=1 Tax=Mucilaginibacter sp. TaxID=1882438 RepID=UPI003D0AEE31